MRNTPVGKPAVSPGESTPDQAVADAIAGTVGLWIGSGVEVSVGTDVIVAVGTGVLLGAVVKVGAAVKVPATIVPEIALVVPTISGVAVGVTDCPHAEILSAIMINNPKHFFI